MVNVWGYMFGEACSVLCMLCQQHGFYVLQPFVISSSTQDYPAVFQQPLPKGNAQQVLATRLVPTLGRRGSPRPGMDTTNEADQDSPSWMWKKTRLHLASADGKNKAGRKKGAGCTSKARKEKKNGHPPKR